MKTLRSFALALSFTLALSLHAQTNTPPAFRLTGKVVDADGRPVAGAIVVRSERRVSHLLGDEGFAEKERVTTSVDGAFELALPSVNSQVLARKPGLVPAWSQYWNPTQDLTNEVLVMAAPTTLAGIVVDETEKPVAEAEVFVSMAYGERPTEDGSTTGGYLNGKPAQDCFSARTGADGKFRIEGFPKNASADLAVRKPGRVMRQPQREYVSPETMLCHAGQQDIKLVVEPAGTIEGRVLVQDTGKPVADVLLTLQANRPGYAGAPAREPAKSGADGSFRLTELLPGDYILRATFGTNAIPDWVANTVTVTVEAGQTKRDVQVSATGGGFLQIVVLGKEDRKPLAGLSVNAGKGGYWAGGTTATNGVALLRLPPGDYQANAYQNNSRSEGTSATVEAGQTNRVEIELSPPPKIAGVVRDPAGAPVAGLQLKVLPEWRANIGNVKTDAKGRYEMPWNPQRYSGQNETLCLIVRDPARNLAAAADLEEDTRTLDLRLEPGLTVTGRVEDVNGKPLTNGTVRVYFWSGNSGSQFDNKPFRADSQGRFEITALPPGRKYSADATAKGFGSANRQIEEGNAETNRIQLEPFVLKVANYRLAGQVVDADDKPVARAWVNMYGQDQPNGSIRADQQGRFKFDHVCEGSIQVSASSQRSYGSARAEAGDTNVVVRLGANESYSVREAAPKRAALKDKPLPDLGAVNLSSDAVPAGKPVLLCLFDIEQRPSRRLVRLLGEQHENLKQKGLTVVCLPAVVTTSESLKEWRDANPVPFPVGQVTEKSDKTKWATDVESLPWLILTDSAHRVTAEGFGLDELDAKVNGLAK